MIENKIKLCEKKICINLKYPDKIYFIWAEFEREVTFKEIGKMNAWRKFKKY